MQQTRNNQHRHFDHHNHHARCCCKCQYSASWLCDISINWLLSAIQFSWEQVDLNATHNLMVHYIKPSIDQLCNPIQIQASKWKFTLELTLPFGHMLLLLLLFLVSVSIQMQCFHICGCALVCC